MRKKNASKKSSNNEMLSALSGSLSAGLTILSVLGVGVAIGYFLDQWLGTTPWCTISLGILGGAGGLYAVYKDVVG